MLKVGIIGFGKMGKTRAEAIKAEGRGQVVSVFDIDGNADFQGLPHAESAEAIIHDPGIEAVFICTPNWLNQSLTIAALKQGKHVFCEKPPAFNASQILEIRETERASQKKLMYGFNHRHHSSIKHMKTLIDSGDFGNILWIRGRYGKSVDNNFFENWRARRELAGGGILLDQGIHMLDLFLYLAGDFHEVQAMVSNLYWKLDIEDNVFAIFRNNRNGIVAQLHSTMTQWRHLFSLEIFLERGYLVLNGLKTSSGTYGEEVLSIARNRTTSPAATWEDEERITFHSDISWRSEIDYFFNAILNDTPIKIGNSADALKIMKIIDKIYANGKVDKREEKNG
jgi:1,5-anhydro-D-fructose reductase (1,5-anhydro-D-mannitol-forming)